MTDSSIGHSTHPLTMSSGGTSEREGTSAGSLPADAPGTIESMMHTYGYTPEAVDQELHHQKSLVENLEAGHSDWGGCWLFFMKVSNSFSFQAFFGTLIVLNAITMGFEADSEKDMEDVYITLENVFCTLFLIEVIVRVLGSSVRPWLDIALMLDVGIVLISVIDRWILTAAGVSEGGSSNDAHLNLSVLTVLRTLRIARVARIFRAIAIFRPIRVLMGSLARAAQNLFWIALLLLVMFYCFGLTFRMMLGETKVDSPVHSVVKNHFSSVGSCILTGIEVLLRGFDWTDAITTPLVNNSESRAASVVWLVFVSSVHVCVANLIVGVFVEQLLTSAKESDELVSKEALVTKAVNIGHLKQVFSEMDTKKCGTITRTEFRNKIRANPDYATRMGIVPEEADVLMDSMDFFGQTDMRIDDLLFAVMKMKGGTKSVDTMCFDYQIKQIVRQVQRSPAQIGELGRQLEKFDQKLKDLSNSLDETREKCITELEGVPKRLEKLEEKMERFTANFQQVPRSANAKTPVAGSGTGMSLTNLRESYQLADEMRELRRVMEQATAATATGTWGARPPPVLPAQRFGDGLPNNTRSAV